MFLTTDFSENTGNARIVSINNIRDFIREICEIRGKITQPRLDFSPLNFHGPSPSGMAKIL